MVTAHFFSIVMPLITFDKVLKIILTILNVLSAALRAFGSDIDPEYHDDDNQDGHA